MEIQDYTITSKELMDEALRIETLKRPAYTVGSVDVLRNFKSVAERVGITPMQAWAVYFLKHLDAITSAAKDKNIPQGEPLLGRFADAVNYLKLGFALLRESEQK